MRKLQLDGLRFVLCLLVFAMHYASDPVRVGYLSYALPVFFVMSGFLITNVLLSADHLGLSAKLKTFYARRILRICPSYFLLVGILIAMGALRFPGYYLTYLLNFKLFAASLDPQSPMFLNWFVADWRKENLHLWSVSVAVQFYVVYPLMLYLTPARYRALMLISTLLVSIAARCLFMAYVPQAFDGVLLPVCAEYFAWGCLFALLESGNKLETLSPVWTFNLSVLVILGLIAVEFYHGRSGFLQFRTTHYQTPIALAIGFLIWALWSFKQTHPVAIFLSWKPLVYFGGISYTFYLVHLVTLDLLLATGIIPPLLPYRIKVIGSFVLALVMAMAIWHLYEKPIYLLRRYFPYGKSAQRPV